MKFLLSNTSIDFINVLTFTLNDKKLSFKVKDNYLKFHHRDQDKILKAYNYCLIIYKMPTSSVLGAGVPQVNTCPSYDNPYAMTYERSFKMRGAVTSDGSITDVGFYYSDTNTTTWTKVSALTNYTDNNFWYNIDLSMSYQTYIYAYAVNDNGTSIGEVIIAPLYGCFIQGTMITLSDGSIKPIEDITYEDELMVWDFDRKCTSKSKPLWISSGQVTTSYVEAVFSDGSHLRIHDRHRIFNVDCGQFTYLGEEYLDETPIGTETRNSNGERVFLVSIKECQSIEQIKYYGLVSDYHMNIYANNILTSCRYNNLYPIVNMKYIKSERRHEQVNNLDLLLDEVSIRYINGLRLSEYVNDDIDTIIRHLKHWDKIDLRVSK